MQAIREWWNALRNFMIIVSFIMNFVLLVIVGVVMQQLFTIKNEVAEPLIDGLHSNFVGLEEAQIQTNVTVDDSIFIDFDLNVQQDRTVVVLVEDVLIGNIPASFATGPGSVLLGSVTITLPAGTQLPVSLDMMVPVEQEIPVILNVPVDIALVETELADPFQNLQALFEPLVNGLNNLPGRWADVPTFTIKTVNGEYSGDNDLLRTTEGAENSWSCESVWGRPCEADDIKAARAAEEAAAAEAAETTQTTSQEGTSITTDTPDATPVAPPDNFGVQATPTFTPFPQ